MSACIRQKFRREGYFTSESLLWSLLDLNGGAALMQSVSTRSTAGGPSW